MSFGAAVQNTGFYDGGTASTASTNVALNNPVTSGNIVVAFVGAYFAGVDPNDITFTDDKNNTYNVFGNTEYVNTYRTKVFYLVNVTNGPQTFTVTTFENNTATAVAFRNFAVEEFTGSPTAFLDASSTNSAATVPAGTDTATSGNFTTTQNGDLVYAAYSSTTFNTPNAGTGYTIGLTPGNVFNATEHRIQATAGTNSATFSPTATDTDGATFALAFAPGTSITWGFDTLVDDNQYPQLRQDDNFHFFWTPFIPAPAPTTPSITIDPDAVPPYRQPIPYWLVKKILGTRLRRRHGFELEQERTAKIREALEEAIRPRIHTSSSEEIMPTVVTPETAVAMVKEVKAQVKGILGALTNDIDFQRIEREAKREAAQIAAMEARTRAIAAELQRKWEAHQDDEETMAVLLSTIY
jgi:hypothetical protein